MKLMLKETEWIWHRLPEETRPVVLYGMGDGADKLLKLCGRFGVRVQGIFASDEFVRGQQFAGFTVQTYRDIAAQFPDALILVAFGTERPEVLERIYTIAGAHEVLAPDIPLFGEELASPEVLREKLPALEAMYGQLADEQSRRVLAAMLDYKLSGKIEYLRNCETPREEIFSGIFSLEQDETYIDLGAYDGDTVQEFVRRTGGQYRRILAFEPDKKNYVKLERNVTAMELPDITLFPCASWSTPGALTFAGKGGRNSALGEKGYTVPAESVDHVLAGDEATYIKMDVEGAEYETLLGCRVTISRYAPKLAVSAYHRTWDLLELAQLLWQLNPQYRVYLRHHPYIPGWETNLYACAP